MIVLKALTWPCSQGCYCKYHQINAHIWLRNGREETGRRVKFSLTCSWCFATSSKLYYENGGLAMSENPCSHQRMLSKFLNHWEIICFGFERPFSVENVWKIRITPELSEFSDEQIVANSHEKWRIVETSHKVPLFVTIRRFPFPLSGRSCRDEPN